MEWYNVTGTHVLRGCWIHDQRADGLSATGAAYREVYDATEPVLGLYYQPSV